MYNFVIQSVSLTLSPEMLQVLSPQVQVQVQVQVPKPQVRDKYK